jgi:hypothetical protein
MKKKIFLFCSVSFFVVLLTGCLSVERPFTKVYTGETEQLLLNTRWELQDRKSIDNFTLIVEFGAEGAVSWFNVPDSYNRMLSEKSTWKREGGDVVFNSGSGRYLYEGKIDNNNGTIAGRYKTGTTKRNLSQSYPEGDFIMVKVESDQYKNESSGN